MGVATKPVPAKLILPMLANDSALFTLASERLCCIYGPVYYISNIVPFTHTTYYAPEFGTCLMRQFVSFVNLVDPGSLAEIKERTDALEMDFAVAGKRRINLDPGYLTLAKFVLATTKDQSHRIYLGKGIYAEVTCNYRRGAWQVNPWTYPDYQSPEYLKILADIRLILLHQLRS